MVMRRVPDTERFGRQNADKERQERETRDALRFDGSQFVRLYEKMQALIADLTSTVTTLVSSLTYTKVQIDSKVASPGAIAPTSVTASGGISAGGDLSVGGQFNCVDSYNFDITYTRRTAWLGNDGRLGYASSSRTKKTAIRPANIDVDAFLSLEPQSFEYIAQHAWKQFAATLPEDDPRYNPDYQVPTDEGLIAEEMVEAGLSQYVIFDAEGNPEGIEYSMLVVPLLAVARAQNVRLVAVEAENVTLRNQIATIASHLNLHL